MEFFVSVGCFLPGIAQRRSWLDQVGARLASEGISLAGLPLRSVVGRDEVYSHYEGPWNQVVFNGAHMVYDPRPDLLHRLAFPRNAELALEWCDNQAFQGGQTSTHWLPDDRRLPPNTTLELCPELDISGREANDLAAQLSEVNGRHNVITWDTWHTRRGPWHKQGPWIEAVAPYVGVIHLQPRRDNPLEFEHDCHDGSSSNVLYALQQLICTHGVNVPIIVEVDPRIVVHNHSWRTLTSPETMLDHVLLYIDKARAKLGGA